MPVVADLIKNIRLGGRSTIQTGYFSSRSNPDGQVRLRHVLYPSLVYEVAHNQSEADHEKIVDLYIGDWPGDIGAVLYFNFDKQREDPGLEYTATVSLWTGTMTEDEDGMRLEERRILKQIFWQEGGEAVAGSLKLPLELFIPPNLRQTVLPDSEEIKSACVCLDFAEMGEWAADAVARQKLVMAAAEAAAEAPPVLRAAKRITNTDIDGNVTVIEMPAGAGAVAHVGTESERAG
ncbi:hypothetical protein F5Y14DRAFT_410691 [Nemania sp. NC0429]|nr:hypothetical protein F5Y14DRAFT_410691 [Nemania sp. NC0429]